MDTTAETGPLPRLREGCPEGRFLLGAPGTDRALLDSAATLEGTP